MHNLKTIGKVILLLEHFIATHAVLATHNADVQIRTHYRFCDVTHSIICQKGLVSAPYLLSPFNSHISTLIIHMCINTKTVLSVFTRAGLQAVSDIHKCPSCL